MTDTRTTAAEERSGFRIPSSLRGRSEWRRTLVPLAAVLALSLLIRGTLFESFSVPAEAMSPALIPGDIVIVNKQVPAPGRLPAYGSIVVYLDSSAGDRLLVRRVIGRPGDRIRIRDGRVLRNGTFVTESWTTPDGGGSGTRCAQEKVGRPLKKGRPPQRPERFFDVCADSPELPDQAILAVPKDQLFVLGDRRAVPTEIAEEWLSGNRLLLPIGAGLIPRPQIVGTVTRILLSIRPPGEVPGLSWTERIRWDRFWKRIEIP